MRFKTIEYLEWAKTHERSEIELTRSSVDDYSFEAMGMEFRNLKLNVARGYGFTPLLKAVAELYDVGPERVCAVLGTSHALFLVGAALIEPEDEVLVEVPAYEPLRAVPAALGARIKRFRREYESGFQTRLNDFERALSSRTRLVILSNLHNPSGVRLDPTVLKGLIEKSAAVGADVLIDEVYLDFVESPGRGSAARMGDNVIAISSLTKAYGMGGLRCGWVIARPEVIERVDRVMDYVNVEGVHIGEQISLSALRRLEAVRDLHRSRIIENREMVDRFITASPALSWVKPDGGVVGFPRIETGIDGDQLAEELRRRYSTGIVPGRFFERPDFFRIAFGGDGRTLRIGLRRIGQALEDMGSR